MLQTEPMALSITAELQSLVKRLVCLRENFDSLADDFGVHIDHPPMPDTAEGHPDTPGLDGLRTEITRINTQIALIEQLHERLFAARAQLFGVGDGRWQESDKPLPDAAGNYGPGRTGNFRTH